MPLIHAFPSPYSNSRNWTPRKIHILVNFSQEEDLLLLAGREAHSDYPFSRIGEGGVKFGNQ